MKKSLITAAITALLSLSTYSQGTVDFANFTAQVNAPIFLADGVTRLSGPAWMAILLAGASQSSLGQIATTTLLTGAGAGYFNGGSQTIATVTPGGTAYCQVGYWDSTLNGTTTGATFQQAVNSGLANVWGQSSKFPVQTGGVGTPPSSPAPLLGLMFPVPEPSVSALLGLGALLLTLRSRNPSS